MNPKSVPRKATERPSFKVFPRICRINSSESAFLTTADPVGSVEKINIFTSGRIIKKKIIATTNTRAILVKMSYLLPDRFCATNLFFHYLDMKEGLWVKFPESLFSVIVT